jgi:hypothetical protein
MEKHSKSACNWLNQNLAKKSPLHLRVGDKGLTTIWNGPKIPVVSNYEKKPKKLYTLEG